MCCKGLIRIRHFGLFANRRRAASLLRSTFLADCRQTLPYRIMEGLPVTRTWLAE
jgi:hypothetical protein